MEIAAKLDDYGKPAWIIVMVLGFILFWPIGLAILAFLIWSGRMGSWKHSSAGHWHGGRGAWSCGGKRKRSSRQSTSPSGNAAFDEYREETLSRLEEEQKEFLDYLERLRQAKDKSEFDQFMAERGMRPEAPDASKPPKDKDPKPQPEA
jgi:hypothetical protein